MDTIAEQLTRYFGGDLPEHLQAGVSELSAQGIETYEDLLKSANNQELSPETRAAISHILGLDDRIWDHRKSVWPLIRALDDPIPNVRLEAAKALQNVHHRKSLQALLRTALDDTDSDVRMHAVYAIRHILDERVLEPFMNMMVDQSEEIQVRAAVIVVLGDLQNSKAVPNLISLLADPSREIRARAASALGQIQDKRAVEPLLSALDDERVDWNIFTALGDLGDPRAIERLMRYATNHDDYSPHYRPAIYALAALQHVDAIEPLIALLRSTLQKEDWRMVGAISDGLIGYGELAVAPLSRLMADSNSQLRDEVINILREIGTETAVDVIIGALDDPDPEVVEGAVLDLVGIGSERTLTAVRRWQQRTPVSEQTKYIREYLGAKRELLDSGSSH